jgi:hypothetical protein
MQWQLDAFLDRLARKDHLDGVMLLGTTGTDDFSATSDIDILLVFSEMVAPLRIVNTWIEGRFVEIYCTTSAAIERIVSSEGASPDGSEEATIQGWLRDGRIYLDRRRRIGNARQRASGKPAPTLPKEDAIHEAWRKIGYNIAQIERYVNAADPVSQTVVDMRLLYSVDEVKVHYFTVRGLRWRGEKPAIRYWEVNDPGFLQELRGYFGETSRRERVDRYVSLARLALAPLAPPWGIGETAISLGAGYGTGDIPGDLNPQRALDFWHELTM